MPDQFTPAAPDPVDPEDALASLEADFQERVDPPDILVVEEEPPPIGRSWSFDFTTGRFRTGGGSAALTTSGIATLVVWCEKCLRTARGAHPIHPPGYGLRDPKSLIAQIIDGAPVAELESRIREALTFHPRIADITDFDWDYDPSDEWVSVTFTLVLDDDTLVPLDALTLASTAEF